MYIDNPISEYLSNLAAKKEAPGGGSAAALSAAIGAGLMSMVANYTIDNPKYKANREKITDILSQSENSRRELELLVDKDVEAYNKLSKSLKGSRVKGQGSGGEVVGLDEAYKEALMPPYEVCKIASKCLGLCKGLAEYGNKNLITDTAIAAIMLEGAFFSAKFNVYENLKYIGDMDFVGGVHKVLFPLETSMPELKEEILEMCEEIVQK